MRRTKAEALETRSVILDAAEQVFFERGVSQTSLTHIASHAGLTRGAIYWHFSGKSDLFMAMHERAYLPQRVFLESQNLLAEDRPLQALERTMRESMRRFAKDERAKRVYSILMLRCEYVGEMESVMCTHREGEDHMRDVIQTAFTRARAVGEMRSDVDSQTATNVCVGAMTGILTEWLRRNECFDLIEAADMALGSLFTGFRAMDRSAKAA
ncbi:TetR family transcriptional regulator [Aureimonas phyllosphaerae]|uniref:TetR/AcrR family acrAB operon transcriptional repressor n=1 Tax=Aureimonas phyllosphaerae TaxID=1166078 RepID=A0A7W6BM32_9HYPH|nr:TetR family transcriptional regulator [Aureimonas phyllosphaerae]MBB3934474.1 TetR/AcrR family acrAB operon transcriptional repressor [Aureimonas phyllosphaerae]MBB3958310.1 TetR/AcrR family acrAB operon transcriptional repressor [Aureimonas phyllosphaerae]SFE95099.1 transcriptional regulator, TetR family [Aureimonas phyllosphaerae]